MVLISYKGIIKNFFLTMIGFLILTVLSMSGVVLGEEAASRPSILIIGTPHFQNVGRDQINYDVEDIMTAVRQEEISDFLEKIKGFSPTHIAVEFPAHIQGQLDESYKAYLEGALELTRKEHHQFGFRLGKLLGLKKIHAVDWNGNPPGDMGEYDWVTFARENNMQEKVDRISDPSTLPNIMEIGRQTVSEWLAKINEPEVLQAFHGRYFDIAAISVDQEFPGANWVGTWYARNLKILNNIHNIAPGPDARVVVIYGIGHAYLLNQFARESHYFNVENLAVLKD